MKQFVQCFFIFFLFLSLHRREPVREIQERPPRSGELLLPSDHKGEQSDFSREEGVVVYTR